MKIVDKLLSVDPELGANSDIYKVAKTWIAIGSLAVIGGIASHDAGLELGEYVATGGSGVLWLGGGALSMELSNISQNRQSEAR